MSSSTLPRAETPRHSSRDASRDSSRIALSDWAAYWHDLGQPWRLEPELSLERRAYLAARLAIVPDVTTGRYPFAGERLTRGDVEWLLATHEDGRGPIHWADERGRNRRGIDLRGAELGEVNLSGLPLARVLGGLPREAWLTATPEQRELAAIHLEHADLSHAHLEGAFLAGARLNGADLTWAQLTRAHLADAHLEQATLARTDLRKANLSGARMDTATLSEARMERVNLRDAYLRSANLTRVYAERANLSAAHLEGADASSAILDRANLWQASLTGATLAWASLVEANLLDAHLEGAALDSANLSGARLTRAHLEAANLSYAQARQTDLTDASLQGTCLWGISLGGADLSRAHLEGMAAQREQLAIWRAWHADIPTRLPAADLRMAIFDSATVLDGATLGDHIHGGVALADVLWEGVNLRGVDWSSVRVLGDELPLQQQTPPEDMTTSRQSRIETRRIAADTYERLAAELRGQGVRRDAQRFSWRARLLRGRVVLGEAVEALGRARAFALLILRDAPAN